MQRIRTFCLALVLASGVVVAEDTPYDEAWGPATGTEAPAIAAPDHTGRERSLDDLARANGLLILFNRSADW